MYLGIQLHIACENSTISNRNAFDIGTGLGIYRDVDDSRIRVLILAVALSIDFQCTTVATCQ